MLTLGIVLIVIGLILELLGFGGWSAYRPYRGYGWGLGGLLIVVGAILVVLALLGVVL